MKKKLDFNKNNKYQSGLNCLFPKVKIRNYLLLIILFFTSSYGYSEEFVAFANNNSQFEINVPSMNSSKIVNGEILSKLKLYNVYSFKQLTDALDRATGGEVIVVRKSLRNEHFHYRQKFLYKKPILILGMLDNNKAPFLDDITWEKLNNVTISHFRIKNTRAKNRYDYSWQIRNSNKVRLTNLHFSGRSNNLVALKNNNLNAILNSQSGLLVKQSNNVIIDRTLFSDLFHAVEFSELNNFYALSNKSIRIASDMFSGGGINNALFDSNLSHTRTPVHYKRWSKINYVHSDMIQLYTTNMKRSNTNITIRNNVSLVGDTPLTNRNLSGWQCFFTRDESGDARKSKALPYSNINIINNFCASNQHHGVTLSRGYNNVLAGNFILLVDEGKTSREATGSIKVFDNKNCKILGNVANDFELDNLSGCHFFNNIKNFKPDYNQIIAEMRGVIRSTKKRKSIEPTTGSDLNELRRYYTSKGPKAGPLQYFDYSQLTLVPAF